MLIIDATKTKEQFGYDPNELSARRQNKVVVCCSLCNTISTISRKSLDNRKSNSVKYCRQCPESSKKRSEIAKASNKQRAKKSEKYQKYLPFLDDLKSGKVGFLEISNTLDLDDSTVCRFYKKHFGIKSKVGNKSLQEDRVFELLKELYPDCKRSVRYSSKSRHIADFYTSELGFIEYDGAGFYHIEKESDSKIDSEFNPIRLSAQAFFGGTDYLKWKLSGELSGYCGAKSPKEYEVKLIEKINKANDMLENCHPLQSSAGKIVFGLYHRDKLIGVAKFGSPTNPYDRNCTELRRFFILDGTPRNTESWFLDKCIKRLPSGNFVTYIHDHEKGSYLKALGWTQLDKKEKSYDYYEIEGKLYSKRRMWGWAKKLGLVDKLGTTDSKDFLAKALGGKKVTLKSKIKFEHSTIKKH